MNGRENRRAVIQDVEDTDYRHRVAWARMINNNEKKKKTTRRKNKNGREMKEDMKVRSRDTTRMPFCAIILQRALLRIVSRTRMERMKKRRRIARRRERMKKR